MAMAAEKAPTFVPGISEPQARTQCLRPIIYVVQKHPGPPVFRDLGGGVLVEKPGHLDWLFDTGERRTTACGRKIEIWTLHPKDDVAILSAWAWHFRQHYITDADLPAMVDGTGLSKADYLRTRSIPRCEGDAGSQFTLR